MKKIVLIFMVVVFVFFTACSDDDSVGYRVNLTVNGNNVSYTHGISDLSSGTAVAGGINNNELSIIAFQDSTTTNNILNDLTNLIVIQTTNYTVGTSSSNGTRVIFVKEGIFYETIGDVTVVLTSVGVIEGDITGAFTCVLSNTNTGQVSTVSNGIFKAKRINNTEAAWLDAIIGY